ncbi:RNA polymerase subunit sigma [Sporosarcina sp. FSL W7-1349]|uniref:RNA polymerase subunit sigma n=1 Tax=Sporosarcina sp. FSL W7-1349 TaxID=2921561 RepID=UPI0030F5EAF7
MSLKGIELQIAIPKTFEAGRVAEQKQQQSQLNQDLANAQTEKQAVKNRETVLETEKYAKLDKDGDHQQENPSENEGRGQQQEEEKKAVHPYKGAFVDFTG